MNKYALLMIFSALIAAVSQMLLKKSALKKYDSIIWEYINPYVIAGYALLVSTLFINIVAYTGIEYKLGAILATTSYLFVMIFGRIFFNEKITKKKVAGISLIILGIIVFNI